MVSGKPPDHPQFDLPRQLSAENGRSSVCLSSVRSPHHRLTIPDVRKPSILFSSADVCEYSNEAGKLGGGLWIGNASQIEIDGCRFYKCVSLLADLKWV